MKFQLVVGSFIEPFEPRFAEYVQCLEKNIECKALDQIHVLIEEPQATRERLLSENTGPSARRLIELLKHSKITLFPLGQRMTFEGAFRYCNTSFGEDHLAIVANADVYFDDSLTPLASIDWTDVLVCLSRHDYGTPDYGRFTTGYDSWIFKTPLRSFLCDWHLGSDLSDLRLNEEAAKSGLRLLNPCLSIKMTHLHGSGLRRRKKLRKPGPTRQVPPSRLIETPIPKKEETTPVPIEVFSIRDLSYDMPPGRAPSMPPPRRGMSRLLLVDRKTRKLSQHGVTDLPKLLGDRELVVNVSGRRPSRMWLYTRAGKRIEAFLLEKKQDEPERWLTICRGFDNYLKVGSVLHTEESIEVTVEDRDDNRWRVLEFEEPVELEHDADLAFPPYVQPPPNGDGKLYESPWAEIPGSVLASTTTAQIDEDTANQLKIRKIALHSTTGCLASLRHMDTSRFIVRAERYEILEKPSAGCVAAGAGALRAIETWAESGEPAGMAAVTFTPGHEFKLADGLLTTLQAPMSSSLMALASVAGIEMTVKLIKEAKETAFRFLDYGDLVLVL